MPGAPSPSSQSPRRFRREELELSIVTGEGAHGNGFWKDEKDEERGGKEKEKE
jgi:hypothetical protein